MSGVLDSPLNKAHQQGRKADHYLKVGKFDEALQCHKIAADLVSQAVAKTKDENAIQSLTLQYHSHLRQIEIIRLRQRKAEALMHKLQVEKSENPTQVTHQDEPAPGDMEESLYLDENAPEIEEIDNTDGARTEEDTDDNTENEFDSLLQIFYNQSGSRGIEKQLEYLLKARKFPDDMFTTAHKTLKNDTTVIEELRIRNQALEQVIATLIRQNEDLGMENKKLREQIQELERQQTTLSLCSDNSEIAYQAPPSLADIHSLELPPLEMPTFDFGALGVNALVSNVDNDEVS